MKKLLSIITAITLLFSVSACTTAENESSVSETSSDVSETSIEASEDENSELDTPEYITIVDQAGREITLETPAETIVSAYYITSYTAIALGLEDKLIGIENKADTRSIYAMAAEELISLPPVGSLKEFNIEATAELNPDLVIMPISLLEQAEILTDLGLAVLVVNPETREDLEVMIRNIGIVTGSEDRAEALLNAQTEIYDTVTALVDGKVSPNVYMGSNSSYLETATSKMYQDFLISHAGGVNVFADIEDDYWTAVSYEAIIEKNPDYIIIPSGASYTIEEVMADTSLQDVNAVKNGNVYQMPTGYEELDSPVPSGVLGVYWLAVTLHGTEEEVESYNDTFNSFYNEFYGIELN